GKDGILDAARSVRIGGARATDRQHRPDARQAAAEADHESAARQQAPDIHGSNRDRECTADLRSLSSLERLHPASLDPAVCLCCETSAMNRSACCAHTSGSTAAM